MPAPGFGWTVVPEGDAQPAMNTGYQQAYNPNVPMGVMGQTPTYNSTATPGMYAAMGMAAPQAQQQSPLQQMGAK